ncbi:indolepyruvate ferredoxin oxidoreductase [Rhodothalassium salexigens]|uniref:indolepyruvate ferredoxin oxidoreductase family protein n=1 Tax=Rhodothalassium salexigens TaxID=1086 RepID=UPI0019132872|nr:indolepyruvate ferredoxin oxidoreductase family protein [Rhodothalassium salexigens]MBK5919523.1 indolepyruvate ferredoxin oxidoreductase [Rhodothalassium salexigens]
MFMQKVTLDDKYTLRTGRVYLNGMQALTRLPLVMRWRDAEAGLNTAGFISGYRGSPLGGYDLELSRAKKYLDAENIVFQPGLNEDLAATAVWGSQQVNLSDQARYDGVFGIWYGKGPGVDRSMDVFKHANAAGTSPHGGVLAIAGDDHGAKSSTLPHQTEHNFMAAMMPVLYPAGVAEYVEYGILGLEMSRYTGAWVAFKAVGDTADTSATVDLAGERRRIVIPTDFEMPADGLHIRWPDPWRGQDTRLQRYKGFAAHAFARANMIDRTIWSSPNDRIGIITTGKAYLDVRQALAEMGIDETRAAEIGLRLYKVGMIWPLEPEGAKAFAEGLDEILVVEEKRELIEYQLMQQLYNVHERRRPRIVGKHDENGQWLLSPDNELDVTLVAEVIASRLVHHYDTPELRAKLAYFRDRETAIERYQAPADRPAYFCSGCPHNTSTKVPDGSRALAGIGCHILAINMDRNTEAYTQMGGEGVPWIGQAPFTDEAHVFVNLGDGTYTHSGLLAIRAAVAAKVNVTYKILFNDAVAMTGGQPTEGQLGVPDIARQLLAEGVEKVHVLSERPEIYTAGSLPGGIAAQDRKYLDQVQREVRATPGVTAIIYDQTCAAEKRRRRKRGKMEDPDQRIFINDLVCEGCGDCSVQSNCVSIEPQETEFGRKRRINQSSCNKDFSCIKGFCPSFVTVEGAKPAKSRAGATATLPDVPLPAVPALGDEYNLLVTGIGGTGVLTVGAILGMATHLDGHSCQILDMSGLAQKNGAVLSHVRLSAKPRFERSPRILTGATDLLLACDSVVAAGKDAATTLSPKRSRAVINSNVAPTAGFVLNRDIDFQEMSVQRALDERTAETDRHRLPAAEIATLLFGDSIATNLFMLGYAWQQGYVPVSLDAINRAIELNGVAVEMNQRTFHWGRVAAHDMDQVERVVEAERNTTRRPIAETLDERIERRAAFLVGYQNNALAERYHALVDRVRAAERAVAPKSEALTDAVARFYFKLLAYKDEYEVARLYVDGEFADKLNAAFADYRRVKVHMAPPLLSRTDPATGRPKKRAFGPWIFPVFKILAALRGLRGTAFDPFGRTAERRMERRLIAEYEELVDELLSGLTAERLPLAVELAHIPDQIRGYGPVKEDSVTKAKTRERELMARWRSDGADRPLARAAE